MVVAAKKYTKVVTTLASNILSGIVDRISYLYTSLYLYLYQQSNTNELMEP